MVGRAVLELVHRLLLGLVVRVLIEVARRARVVVAAVHAEGATPVAPHQLLVASVATHGPHLLESVDPEVLRGATFAEPALFKGNLRARCRVPA